MKFFVLALAAILSLATYAQDLGSPQRPSTTDLDRNPKNQASETLVVAATLGMVFSKPEDSCHICISELESSQITTGFKFLTEQKYSTTKIITPYIPKIRKLQYSKKNLSFIDETGAEDKVHLKGQSYYPNDFFLSTAEFTIDLDSPFFKKTITATLKRMKEELQLGTINESVEILGSRCRGEIRTEKIFCYITFKTTATRQE